ncbi:MAG: hypothetical protein HY907_16105 [Deltaproteobacteria bacterium]|nr:hypothetical protein [Deltaproteobacteria bacterium]
MESNRPLVLVFAALGAVVVAVVAGCGRECPASCGEGMMCIDGACVSACNPPCPATMHCNPERNACEPFGSDADADADAPLDELGAGDADADAPLDELGAGDADADAPLDELGAGDADAGPPVVDLVLLVENAGSWSVERANLEASLDTLMARYGSGAYGWDLAIGVAHFGDFPVTPHGSRGDQIFGVVQVVSTSLASAVAAVATVPYLAGGDAQDGAVEGLYRLATAAPLPPYWTPTGPCPTGGLGALCFRPGSQRFVLMFTDSEMHNGPPDGLYEPWSSAVLPSSGALATYPGAIAALHAAGVRVIVIDTWDQDYLLVHEQCAALAADSGAVTASGSASYQLPGMSDAPQDLGFVLDTIAELLP